MMHGQKNIKFLQNVQSASGAQTTLYPTDIFSSFPRLKQAGRVAENSLYLVIRVKNLCTYTSALPYAFTD